MSIRAALARHLTDLAACPPLLADLEADLELALAHQQVREMMAPPRLLLAIERAGGTEVCEVELAGVEWADAPPPAAPPPRPPRTWEEELPNRLVRPLGAAGGLGAMLQEAAPTPHRQVARLIADD